MEGRFVTPGTAFGMDTDTVVVASVMCEECGFTNLGVAGPLW